jgi:DNA-binding NarL/FixJ family response regulator
MQLTVCESGGNRATWLKHDLAGEVVVTEIRRLEEIWPLLDRRVSSIVALEITASGVETSLDALCRVAREYPATISVALATRRLAALGPAAREAGAALFLESARELRQLASLARYLAARSTIDQASDANVASIEDRVFASLPWRG